MDSSKIDCAPSKQSLTKKAKFKLPLSWGQLKFEPFYVKSESCCIKRVKSDVSEPVSDSISDLLSDVLKNLDNFPNPFEDSFTLEDDLNLSDNLSIDDPDLSASPPTSPTTPRIMSCFVKLGDQPINWNMDKMVLPDGSTRLRYTRYKCDEEEEKEEAVGQDVDHDKVKLLDLEEFSILPDCINASDSDKVGLEVEQFDPSFLQDEIEQQELKEETSPFVAVFTVSEVKDEFLSEEEEGPIIQNKSLRDPIDCKRYFDKESKEAILQYNEKFGPAETCRKYAINNSMIYYWKKHGLQNRYSDEFKEDAVHAYETMGLRKAAKTLNLSLATLVKWKKEMGGESKKRKFSDEFKKDALKYYAENGSKAALAKYEHVDSSQLSKWKKQFATELEISIGFGRSFDTEKRSFQKKVVEYSKENGLKAAAEKFNASLPNIWEWRAKENKRLKNRKMQQQARQKQKKDKLDEILEDYSQEFKDSVVEHYKEHGSKSCEEQFHVPRQTFRNWAIKMGEMEIGTRRTNVEKSEVLEMATKAGVQKTLEKYPVKRAILYVWAKALGAEVSQGSNNSLELTVSKQGMLKKLVFGRVKKPKKKKEKKVRIPKPPKIKPKKPWEMTNSLELPEWAASFIQRPKKPVGNEHNNNTLPCVLSSESSPLISQSNIPIFNCDIFSMSVPVASTSLQESSSQQDSSSSSDSSSDSEYECDDYSDFLYPLPFFSPNPQLCSSPSVTIDPPNTVRKQRRTPGQGISQ